MNDFATLTEILTSLDANDGVWIEIEAERFSEGDLLTRLFAHAATMEAFRTVYDRRSTSTECFAVEGEARAVLIGRNPKLFEGVAA